MRRVTVTALASFSVQDFLGLEDQQPGSGVTANFSGTVAVPDVRSFDLTEGQWNRVRPVLSALSQKRQPVIESGLATPRTQPLMTYTVERVPGDRPRVHQLEGSVSVGGGTQTVTLRGENLIAGLAAFFIFNKGSAAQLTVTAVRKGPGGNRVSISIAAPLGAGSVTVTRGIDGRVSVAVVPAAAGPGAVAIAAQINAHVTGSVFVSAVGGGVGAVGVKPDTSLSGGDGSGAGFADFATALATAWLRVEAQLPGNGGNRTSIKINAPLGAGSVVVVGSAITVTPAAAGPDIAAIAAQINADATAFALVKATPYGAGATVLTTPVGFTFLATGAAETPTAKVAGAVASISSYTDVAAAVVFTGAAVTAAGLLAGEQAVVTLLADYQVLQAQIVAIA
jgi:hypothetical protein